MANFDPSQAQGGGAPGGGMAPPQGGGPSAPSLLDAMQAQTDNTAAVFDKMQAAGVMLSKARAAMDELVKLGDSVTADDAIGMGGELVAAGLSSTAVASLFADMPPGGDGLVGWIKQQDEGLKQREQQLEAARKATQHHMGVNAFRMLSAGAMPRDEGAPNAA